MAMDAGSMRTGGRQRNRMPDPEPETGFGQGFWRLTLSNGFFFAGFHMLLPTVPLLALALGGTKTEVGLIAGIFVFSSVITRLFADRLLALLGGKGCLMAGILISGGAALLYPVMPSVDAVLTLRIIHGVGFGIGTTFYLSLVMDLIPPGRKGQGIGYFGLATTLAMAVAPASGLWIYDRYGVGSMFLLAVGCEAAALLLCLSGCSLPGRRRDAPARGRRRHNRTPADLMAVFVEPGTLRAAIMTVLFGTAYGSVLNFVAVYAQELHLALAGAFFMVATACIFVTRLLTGPLGDKWGTSPMVAAGAALLAAGLLFLANAQSVVMFLASAVLYGLGIGVLYPGLQMETMSRVAPQRRSAASATFSNALDLGLGGGSVLLGWFAQGHGLPATYLCAALASAALIAVLFGAARIGPATTGATGATADATDGGSGTA